MAFLLLCPNWLTGKIFPLHAPAVTVLHSRYQERGGAQDVLDAIDSINIHMLPFFSAEASTGLFWIPVSEARNNANSIANNSWHLVLSDLQWFIDHGKGKKMYFDEVWSSKRDVIFD